MDRRQIEGLRTKVRGVLWELDPIGISGEKGWPQDEYDSFVDEAVSALLNHGLKAAAVRLADSFQDRLQITISVDTLETHLSRIGDA
jgi:hypothetical protein